MTDNRKLAERLRVIAGSFDTFNTMRSDILKIADELDAAGSAPPLHPVVQECIDNYGKYYAEQHKLGMSVRSDMIYVAQLALRWADSGGQDSTSPDSHESPAAGHCQPAAPLTIEEIDRMRGWLTRSAKVQDVQAIHSLCDMALLGVMSRIPSVATPAAPPTEKAGK